MVKAVASGVDRAVINRWQEAAPERIIPALVLMAHTPVDGIRASVEGGIVRVLGEAIWQFQGMGSR